MGQGWTGVVKKRVQGSNFSILAFIGTRRLDDTGEPLATQCLETVYMDTGQY